ncbi:hypothetical protein HDV05_000742 [Chytridiales sp. JEL 0842]|nr:hypothetical protein HDV05_000742 [Chytridiales sp. JEL 0842]
MPDTEERKPLLPGAHLPPLKGPMVFIRMATFIIINVLTCVAIVGLQIPSFLLYLHSHSLYRSYIRMTENIFASMLITLLYFCCPGTKLVLTGDYEFMRPKTKSVVICNHQPRNNCLRVTRGCDGDVKIILIEIMKYLPFFGQGMWFYEFIYMKQKWEKDKDNMRKHLLRAKNPDVPLWMLIFPEGTLNTPGNVAKSQAFAKKHNIEPHPKHVILPKSTGLHFSLSVLQPEVTDLFDVTLGYTGIEGTEIPYDSYLVDKVFWKGQYPREVHMHIKRIKVDTIPGFTPEDLKETEANGSPDLPNSPNSPNGLHITAPGPRLRFDTWLRNIFTEKDERLAGFYRNQYFYPPTKPDPQSKDAPMPRKVVPMAPDVQDMVILGVAWYSLTLTYPLYWTILVAVVRVFIFWPLSLLF